MIEKIIKSIRDDITREDDSYLFAAFSCVLLFAAILFCFSKDIALHAIGIVGVAGIIIAAIAYVIVKSVFCIFRIEK